MCMFTTMDMPSRYDLNTYATMSRDEIASAGEQNHFLGGMRGSEDHAIRVRLCPRKHVEHKSGILWLSNAILLCLCIFLVMWPLFPQRSSGFGSQIPDSYCEILWSKQTFSFRQFARYLTRRINLAPANDVVEYEYRRISNDTRFLGPPQAEWSLLMQDLMSGKFDFICISNINELIVLTAPRNSYPCHTRRASYARLGFYSA